MSFFNSSPCYIYVLTIHNYGHDINWAQEYETSWDNTFDVEVFPGEYAYYEDYEWTDGSREILDVYELFGYYAYIDPSSFYSFDEAITDWSYGAWTPHESTVCSSESVPQTRQMSRIRRFGQRNGCGDEMNVSEYTEYTSDSRTVQGTATLAAISGQTFVCPDVGANPENVGCTSPVTYWVTISPVQSGIAINWTGGNTNSATVYTDADGNATYTTTFPSTGTATITASMQGGTCTVSLGVQISNISPTAPGGLQWGQFIRTGSKPIRQQVQAWHCGSWPPLGLTELGFQAFAQITCKCATIDRRMVVAAMHFVVGDYWYGSDVIDYRNNPNDVQAVINGEGEHYNSWEIYAITARSYWNDIRYTTFPDEASATVAMNNLKRDMDAVGEEWLNFNRELDAPGGPHRTLGDTIKSGRCP